MSPAGGRGLGYTTQVPRARAAAAPGLSLLCPVHISSPTLPIRISKGAPAICIQGHSPQAVQVEMEVRSRAKSHIVERQLLRRPQVSALLRALLHSGPSAPSASSRPSCSRTEKLASLPCGCLGRVSHAHRGFTLFEIRNPDLTLQLQVVTDSSNSLFPKCFSLP